MFSWCMNIGPKMTNVGVPNTSTPDLLHWSLIDYFNKRFAKKKKKTEWAQLSQRDITYKAHNSEVYGDILRLPHGNNASCDEKKSLNE